MFFQAQRQMNYINVQHRWSYEPGGFSPCVADALVLLQPNQQQLGTDSKGGKGLSCSRARNSF